MVHSIKYNVDILSYVNTNKTYHYKQLSNGLGKIAIMQCINHSESIRPTSLYSHMRKCLVVIAAFVSHIHIKIQFSHTEAHTYNSIDIGSHVVYIKGCWLVKRTGGEIAMCVHY